MLPVLEAVDGIGEARGGLGEVGRVDLLDVAQTHDLGAGAGPGDQRLHLLGGEVLRLVDDEIAAQKRASAHEVERTDLDPRGQQVIGRRAGPAAAFLRMGQHLEVVGERAHPRRHLFFLGAGQEADVLADRNRRAGHDDLAVALHVHHLRQSGGEREQGLAGAGGAEQGDEIDVRVHQHVEREILLAIARGDAPDGMVGMAVVVQQDQRGVRRVQCEHAQFHGVFARQEQALVGVPVLARVALQAIEGAAALTP